MIKKKHKQKKFRIVAFTRQMFLSRKVFVRQTTLIKLKKKKTV